MKLYHGTNADFNKIDLNKSQVGKDFGRGFYLSADRHQAFDLATYKSFQLGGEPMVQTYEFDEENLQNGSLTFLRFEEYSRDWAEFILANRSNKQAANIHDYDVVYGPIANDKVGIQIRNLAEQNIDFDTFLERLKYMKGITYQYFFNTERAINLLKRV